LQIHFEKIGPVDLLDVIDKYRLLLYNKVAFCRKDGLAMKQEIGNCSANDRVDGLSAKVTMGSDKKIQVKLRFDGKFGQGYDGCGTHTHK